MMETAPSWAANAHDEDDFDLAEVVNICSRFEHAGKAAYTGTTNDVDANRRAQQPSGTTVEVKKAGGDWSNLTQWIRNQDTTPQQRYSTTLAETPLPHQAPQAAGNNSFAPNGDGILCSTPPVGGRTVASQPADANATQMMLPPPTGAGTGFGVFLDTPTAGFHSDMRAGATTPPSQVGGGRGFHATWTSPFPTMPTPPRATMTSNTLGSHPQQRAAGAEFVLTGQAVNASAMGFQTPKDDYGAAFGVNRGRSVSTAAPADASSQRKQHGVAARPHMDGTMQPVAFYASPEAGRSHGSRSGTSSDEASPNAPFAPRLVDAVQFSSGSQNVASPVYVASRNSTVAAPSTGSFSVTAGDEAASISTRGTMSTPSYAEQQQQQQQPAPGLRTTATPFTPMRVSSSAVADSPLASAVYPRLADLTPTRFVDPATVATAATFSPHSGAGTGPYASLSDLKYSAATAARDQVGCRMLQRLLDMPWEHPDVQEVFAALYASLPELMADAYGNFLVQKLLDVAPDNTRLEITRLVAPHLAHISTTTHGTFAAQKLVDSLRCDTERIAVCEGLASSAVSICTDHNGAHVVQKVIAAVGPQDRASLITAITDDIVPIANNRYGTCIVQRCLERSVQHPGQFGQLAQAIERNVTALLLDPFGNYVVQRVIDQCSPRSELVDAIVNRIMLLDVTIVQHPALVSETGQSRSIVHGTLRDVLTSQYSSKAVERALMRATITKVAQFAARLAEVEGLLLAVMGDQFGNFIIQTTLNLATTTFGVDLRPGAYQPDALMPSVGDMHAAVSQFIRFVQAVQAFIPDVRQLSFGKKMEARVEDALKRYRQSMVSAAALVAASAPSPASTPGRRHSHCNTPAQLSGAPAHGRSNASAVPPSTPPHTRSGTTPVSSPQQQQQVYQAQRHTPIQGPRSGAPSRGAPRGSRPGSTQHTPIGASQGRDAPYQHHTPQRQQAAEAGPEPSQRRRPPVVNSGSP